MEYYRCIAGSCRALPDRIAGPQLAIAKKKPKKNCHCPFIHWDRMQRCSKSSDCNMQRANRSRPSPAPTVDDLAQYLGRGLRHTAASLAG